MTTRTIQQVFVQGSKYPNRIFTAILDHNESFEWEDTITSKLLNHPSDNIEKWPFIGFSILQSAIEGGGMYISFATYDKAVVIKTKPKELAKMGHDANWKSLRDLLSGSAVFSYVPSGGSTSEIGTVKPTLVAFDLVQHTLTMHHASNAQLSDIVGIDLECLLPKIRGGLPSYIIQETLGASLVDRGYELLWRKPNVEKRDDVGKELVEVNTVAMRAWMAVLAAEAGNEYVESATEIDTKGIPREDLDLLTEVQQQFDLLEGSKPETNVNDFSTVEPGEHDRQFIINNTAFKNKNRVGKAQSVFLRTKGGEAIEARIVDSKGKRAIAAVLPSIDISSLDPKDVVSVETVGVEDLTTASVARASYMLSILQKKSSLRTSNFIRKIWRPNEEDLEELKEVRAEQSKALADDKQDKAEGEEEDAGKWENLNPSQAIVARAMLSKSNFALVHGPPGTGKTRTIAFVAKQWVNDGEKAYLVAQSNVGVKNIAESLAKNGNLNFKLLVSSQFYDEWHEDIYEGCRPHMIRSEQFKEELKESITDVKLILSTVNMLFSRTLENKGLFKAIPLEKLVVDEASQIFVGDYLALFHKFRRSLKKVCWFGDPRQLPPHQGEQIEGLHSVYDIPHLKTNSLLLDTQFRMPVRIGEFISKSMYEAKLKSSHAIDTFSCLKFVDVSTGHEEARGTSWVNRQEALTVANLVENYYRDLPFCVITPYDSQRKIIEDKLKERGLPSHGHCYNVDSFQGNEAPYIIISTVRTNKTGFLNLMNRVNVMLTRCQKGMIIVSNRYFVRHEARMTMVGQLAHIWSNAVGEDGTWADYLDVQKKYADMPGVDGIPRPKLPTPPPLVATQSVNGFFGIQKIASTRPAPSWGTRSPASALSSTKTTPKSLPGLVPSAPTASAATTPLQGPKIAGAWKKGPTISSLPSSRRTSIPQSPTASTSSSGSGGSKKLVLNSSGIGTSSGSGSRTTAQPKKNAWGAK